MILEFSRQTFEKIQKYQISWKSFQWEQSYSNADRHETNLTQAFRTFANTRIQTGNLRITQYLDAFRVIILLCRGEEISINIYECVSVTLFIQHAVRMRHFILTPIACLDLLYIFPLYKKEHGFRKKGIEHEICFENVSTDFACNISHSEKTKRYSIVNVYSSSCKVPVFLVRF